jgi:sugar lactone lactonase YvrE
LGGVSRYDGKTFVNFTTEHGLFAPYITAIHETPDGVMWFGTSHGGISRYDGKEFVNFTTKNGLVHNIVLAIERDPDGVLWFGTSLWGMPGGGVSRYDGKTFVNFTEQDGLASNHVISIYRDPDGILWFGTMGGGISRYDSRGLSNFTTRDGLAGNSVHDIYHAPDGTLWFGTEGGISWYNGARFTNFTTKDGLLENAVMSIDVASDGAMWFGTRFSGVSRYDGKEFVNFTREDGLADNQVFSVHHDPNDAMWFGGFGGWGAGVSRYDGEKFDNFGEEHGLAGKVFHDIYQDADGVMWFGTRTDGASRYDGKKFENLTKEDGLADNWINTIYQTPDGALWFGTSGGISRYDGKEFINLAKEDGLVESFVQAIHRDRDGVMWFGTEGGGVSLYDGANWTSLDTRDGLAGNNVWAIREDEDGYLWLATLDGGITRYRRGTTPPEVYIVSVGTKDQLYTELDSIPPITVGDDINIEYRSIDFTTVPEKRQYRYHVYETRDARPEARSSDPPSHNSTTKKASFDWTPEKPGTYTFEVQAIDRDLNYSEPVSVEIEIAPLPFYQTDNFLVLVTIIGSISLLAAILLGVQRWRLAHNEKLRLQNELQDAKEMQLSLLPGAAPVIDGMEIAGRSITANTVGGDFFDYLELPDGKVGMVIADVSGKGLRAAMNATMANGMLHEVATIEASCGSILSRLNAHLYPLMERQMFTAFSFAILDPSESVIQWSNAAQPLPLIRRSDGVSEAEEDGQLPLGMASDVKYPDCELRLQTGDVVIFYTDGIIESENESEEMYGTERLMHRVAGIDTTASAESIIEAILQDVSDFAGSAQQYDDMTIVVLKEV